MLKRTVSRGKARLSWLVSLASARSASELTIPSRNSPARLRAGAAAARTSSTALSTIRQGSKSCLPERVKAGGLACRSSRKMPRAVSDRWTRRVHGWLAYPQNAGSPADRAAFSYRDERPDLCQLHPAYISMRELISKGVGQRRTLRACRVVYSNGGDSRWPRGKSMGLSLLNSGFSASAGLLMISRWRSRGGLTTLFRVALTSETGRPRRLSVICEILRSC